MALRTLSEVEAKIFRRSGLDADDTDHASIVRDAVNDAYEDLISRDEWRWLRKEGVITTVAPYSTGTVTVSGTTVTGVGTTFITDMEDRYINIEALGDELYQISTFNSATSLTLYDSVSTNVSTASAYTILQPDYVLADGVDEHTLEYMVDMQDSTYLEALEHANAEYFWPNQGALSEGRPRHYSFVGRDSRTAPYVRLFPIPEDVRAIKYVAKDNVSIMTADSDTPIIPERMQIALEYGALEFVFDWIGKTEMAKKYGIKYEFKIKELMKQNKGMMNHSYKHAPTDTIRQTRGLRLPADYPPRRL